jgi:multiple sugar transport system permease protein
MTAIPTPYRQYSRRRRLLVENLTAYAFLLPAGILIFVFGLFPVLFAFFVSLHRWRRFPDEYIGLGNYQRALGDFTYVLFFWAALAAIIGGALVLGRSLRDALRQSDQQSSVGYLLPGALNAAAILLFLRWSAMFLPVILNIPRRILGQERTQGLFINELFASFRVPEVAEAGSQMLLIAVIAILFSIVSIRLLRSGSALWRMTGGVLLLAVGVLFLQLTLEAINAAIEAARAAGNELPVWSQVILISAGAGLLYGAYRLWQVGVKAGNDRRFVLLALAAILLALEGYLLIAELPRMLASSDANMLSGFSVTIMYAAGAVPFQLAIGLGLAYLLFQNLKGKTFFRMVFFMPYIMPYLATALLFSLIFSHRQDSIINQFIGTFGIPPQKWLLEPVGVNKLLFGPDVSQALSGPSLALVVVIIYTIWTYAGYATVVFLAGLGNIPGELYEAARIDGASGWNIFRHLTLPLLSPTTFFLSLIAIIGTFQAFTQLWLMRTPAAGKTLDTMSIYIFRQITDANPNYGYGAALALVLFVVILLLTFLQNRFAERRVFYG